MWPTEKDADKPRDDGDDSEEDSNDDENIEAQIAKEVASMKRPRKEQRFGTSSTFLFPTHSDVSSQQTVTQTLLVVGAIQPFVRHDWNSIKMTVVFISCKSPVDPVQLVLKHVENVMETGISRTRYETSDYSRCSSHKCITGSLNV